LIISEIRVDYRSGETPWNSQGSADVPTSALRNDLVCEVAVVGGGISGVLTAFELVKRGLHVVLIDRGDFAAQSTKASTGLLLYDTDTHLVDLIRKVGTEAAVHAYRRGLEAIDELEALSTTAGDCGFERRPSLYLTVQQRHLQQLEEEYACRRYYGIDVEWHSASKLRDMCSIPAAGAIGSRGNAQLDPVAFTLRLLAAGCQRGLQAYPHTEVREIRHAAAHIELITPHAIVVAQHVVYATGYGISRQVGRPLGNLNCSYVVASQPRRAWKGWPDGALLWEAARPYYYARLTSDGRAVFGGEDTAFAEDHRRDQLVAEKVSRLVEQFSRWFPLAEFVTEFAWAGTFGETSDGMPYIGRLRGREREYFAAGFGGNGITFSTIAARALANLIQEIPDLDAQVFRFGR
jgi:glycine/D-amino acid oxidase-like deaminating enzyme